MCTSVVYCICDGAFTLFGVLCVCQYTSLHVSILWRVLVYMYYCVFLVFCWCWILSQCGSSGYSMCLYSVILLKLLLLMKLMVYTLFNQTMYVSSLVSLSSSWTLCVSFLYCIFFPFPFKISLFLLSPFPYPSLPLSLQ